MAREKRSTGKELGMEGLGCLAIWELEDHDEIPRETGGVDSAIDTLIHDAILTQRDWNEEPSMQYSEQPTEELYAALKRGITKLEEHAYNAESQTI